ncbi:peptidase S8 and S53 subtilisin kexin sedolisin [Thermus sp. SYSU G05001]|uniref:Peptidase S8 and S53 subtilisin kexin sedolisin n=1 Tax=Thermus brevis TaxID=2862456 RepID=A0ABS6ZZE0_9DEIN|nr:peptidase S8 and S53 subtilisin kexin sedolisin [Thermus brevis]
MKALGVICLGVLALLGLVGCGGGTPPPPNSITLTVLDSQNVGYAAAYQVGSGSWTVFTPSSTHTYTFSLSSNSKYGVAVRCNSVVPSNPPEVHVIQATNAELANPKVTCSGPNPSTVSYTLTVDVTNVPGIASGDLVMVSGQGFQSSGSFQSSGIVTQSGTTYTASVSLNAQAGSQDLVVAVVEQPLANPVNLRATKVLRNVNVSSGGSSSYTFTSGDVLATANVSVTLPTGFTPTYGQASMFYLSNDNKGWGLVGDASGTAAANFPYRPVAGFASGDRYVVLAVAGNSSNVLERFKGSTGGSVSLTLPNPWPASSVAVTCEAHPTVSGLAYTDPNLRAYGIELEDSTLIYQTTLSKGWLGGTTTYTVPDLSSQLGYTPFAPLTTVYVSVSAVVASHPVLNLDSNDQASFTATTDISLIHAIGQYVQSGVGSISLP